MAPTLRLLGGASIQSDGTAVSGPAAHRHRLALLALLSAAPHYTLSRDKLIGFLWPDHGAEDARHLLRQAVYVIRRELGEDVLESAGEQVVLDAEAFTSDLRAFETAVERGEAGRAVELYGGPFLDGFHLPGADEFELWAAGERVRLADAYGASLKTLAETAEGEDWSAASGWWSRLAAHDPYDSAAAFRLVQALAASGDRGGALRHADEHTAFLRRELAAPPDPRLAEFAARLRAQGGPAVGKPPTRERKPFPRPARRGPGLRGALTALAVLAVLTSVLLWTRSRSPGPPASEDRVAVMPFEVRGDERFAYLGEGMVDLLSSKVEGAGRLRSVDPRALLSFVERRGPRGPILDLGRAAAREFGAGLFVAGTVIAAGDRLELHASIYDADGNPRTRLAPVAGAERELFAMVDRVARGIVASRYEAEGERLSRLAATTTTSMPALRSYLSAEAAFRAGRFDQAVEGFRQAAEQDTTFALAWYRLAVAEEWALDLEAAEEAVSRAVRHGSRLAERDRLLLDAWQAYFAGRALEAERLYRRILEAHPEDVEAWFQLGEVQFHYGPPSGRSIVGSRGAFERVLELEPDHEGALLHLARIAARAGQVAEIDSLAEELRRMSPASELAIEMRALAAFAKPDPTAREAIVAELAALDDDAVFTAIWTVSYADPVIGMERLAPILTDADRPPDVRATGHLLLASAALARGQLLNARRELGVAQGVDRDRALPHLALFAVLPFVASPAVGVEAIRTELRSWDADSVPAGHGIGVFLTVHDGLSPHLKAYLTSLLDHAAGEGEASLGELQELERLAALEPAGRLARDLALGARATVLRRADPVEALARLEQVQGNFPYERVVASPFFALSRERFLRAELLRAAGRHDEALPIYASFLDTSLYDLPYLAPAHLAQAEILDERGDADGALVLYRRFIELWGSADPAFRPVVESARTRVAELSGG